MSGACNCDIALKQSNLKKYYCVFSSQYSRTPWIIRYWKIKQSGILLHEEMMEMAVVTTRTVGHANHLHLAPVRSPLSAYRQYVFYNELFPSWYPAVNVRALKVNMCTVCHCSESDINIAELLLYARVCSGGMTFDLTTSDCVSCETSFQTCR